MPQTVILTQPVLIFLTVLIFATAMVGLVLAVMAHVNIGGVLRKIDALNGPAQLEHAALRREIEQVNKSVRQVTDLVQESEKSKVNAFNASIQAFVSELGRVGKEHSAAMDEVKRKLESYDAMQLMLKNAVFGNRTE